MRRKKHKKKVNHIVIFTTDAVDAKVRQCKIRPLVGTLLIVLACVIVGTVFGVLMYEEKLWAGVQETVSYKDSVIQSRDALIKQKEDEMLVLQDEKAALQEEIDALNEKITVLSDTVNLKLQTVEKLQKKLDEHTIPTGFPLTGSATMQEVTEGNPICIFEGSKNTMVVAAADGVVLSIEDDADYGHKITVDHGNGYISIYRNKGDVMVKQGDTIYRGSTLYIIESDNLQLGYQMTKDGSYINPMDVLSISG